MDLAKIKMYAIHVAVCITAGFAAAFLTCASKTHSLSAGCFWEALGWSGGVLALYFSALKQNWPGTVQLPADHPAVKRAQSIIAAVKDPLKEQI